MEPSPQLWSQVRTRCQLGLDQLGLTATAGQIDRLTHYLQLLQEWNRSYNLTAVRDPLQAVDRHLFDSLSVGAWLDPGPALDAGSGAGFPGVPLAIMHPQQRWLLLDSNGKKTRFLRHVARTLRLPNVAVMQQRLERLQADDLAPEWRPVQIVSRAFASLRQQCEWARSWLCDGCRLLAMQGEFSASELDTLPADVIVTNTIVLTPVVTGLETMPPQRHLLVLRRRQSAESGAGDGLTSPPDHQR